MIQKPGNNGSANTPAELQGQSIEFPVTYELKAVMVGTDQDAEHMKKLETVFSNLKIKFRYLNQKESSKGSYVSFTYEVTLIDKNQLDALYADLKTIKELKFAV